MRDACFVELMCVYNVLLFSEFHQLENNLHISQYLADTRETLHNMLRTGSISEDIMISLNIVTDCCYAWKIMESFTDVMQESIKENPPTVIKLKALFLKVSTQLKIISNINL